MLRPERLDFLCLGFYFLFSFFIFTFVSEAFSGTAKGPRLHHTYFLVSFVILFLSCLNHALRARHGTAWAGWGLGLVNDGTGHFLLFLGNGIFVKERIHMINRDEVGLGYWEGGDDGSYMCYFCYCCCC